MTAELVAYGAIALWIITVLVLNVILWIMRREQNVLAEQLEAERRRCGKLQRQLRGSLDRVPPE